MPFCQRAASLFHREQSRFSPIACWPCREKHLYIPDNPMNQLSSEDEDNIIHVLTQSFKNNKSVQYITGTGKSQEKKLKVLINYSLKYALAFGKIYLTADKKACALVTFPHKTQTTFRTILWDLELVLLCIGLRHIGKVLKRENALKKLHPKTPFYYLWYIGVNPDHQGQGIGTALLRRIRRDSQNAGMPIYLETSTEKNIPWYEKNGFRIFTEPLDFSYKLYALRTTVPC